MNDSFEQDLWVNDTITDFIFPSKYLPACFKNDNIFQNIEIIKQSYTNLDELLNIYFEYDGNKIKNFRTIVNKIYRSKKGTEPINFIISKPVGGARTLSICNPLVFIPFHLYIIENHVKVLSEQISDDNNYLSNSRYKFENEILSTNCTYEEFLSGEYEKYYLNYFLITDYSTAQRNNVLMSNGSYYCLKMDISNFYNNIYSHMISWNLMDNSNRTLFENIDSLSRTLNMNETKGILTGPYTSSLISELIMSKIDVEIKKECKKLNVYCVRYCDDYCFYCNSKETLSEKIMPFLEKKMMEYRLDINPHKTAIIEFPFFNSLYDIKGKTTSLLEYLNSDNYDEFEKVEKIISSLDFEIKRKTTSCNYLLKALFSSFKYRFSDNNNLVILIDYLINLMFKYDFLSKSISDLILRLILDNNPDKEFIVEKWITKRNEIGFNVKSVTDIFLIYMIIKLNVSTEKINDYMLKALYYDDICSILVFEYFIRNNLISTYKEEMKCYLSLIPKYLNSNFDSHDPYLIYYSRYWLFLYINFTKWNLEDVSGFKQYLKDFDFLDSSNILFNDDKLEILRIMKDFYHFDI